MSDSIDATDNDQIHRLLDQLLNEAHNQQRTELRREKFWSKAGAALGVGGALGAGVGGVAAISDLAQGQWQIPIVVAAFTGAALSAVGGTVRAPERAEQARLTALNLEAFCRRVEVLRSVDIDRFPFHHQRQLLEAAVQWLEQIRGTAPSKSMLLFDEPVALRVANQGGDQRQLEG